MNICSRGGHGLGDNDRHAALLLASHGALALAHPRSAELADLHEIELHKAIDTRDVIGQAKGILMNRQGISGDAAFALLRSTSLRTRPMTVEPSRLSTCASGSTPAARRRSRRSWPRCGAAAHDE